MLHVRICAGGGWQQPFLPRFRFSVFRERFAWVRLDIRFSGTHFARTAADHVVPMSDLDASLTKVWLITHREAPDGRPLFASDMETSAQLLRVLDSSTSEVGPVPTGQKVIRSPLRAQTKAAGRNRPYLCSLNRRKA